MNILVLEDDPSLRFALAEMLSDIGHEVSAVADNDAAAAELRHRRPDMLLLDLMIGNRSSVQIADLAGYCAPEAEIIYVTGSNRFPSGELFEMSRNASWVLRKPVDFEDLKAMVSHVLGSASGKAAGSALAVEGFGATA